MGTVGSVCRACRADGLVRVLDLGELSVALCQHCALAQLEDAPAAGPCRLPRSASLERVAEAIRITDAAGLLTGHRVREFGGAHGGSWMPLLTQLGFTQVFAGSADVVVDSFAAVHDPDQRAAFRQLADATAPDGVLLLQFESVADMVRSGRWDFVVPQHFAYYSLTALVRLLAEVQMAVAATWRPHTHGGTTLLAAVHAVDWPAEPGVERMLADEHQLKITTPEGFAGLQEMADEARRRESS